MVIILVLIVHLTTYVQSSGCPAHCFCYKWKNLERTDCVGKNLFNTFVRFSHQTQVLDLSYNVITVLHGNEFLDGNLRKLKDLRLCNNRLQTIDKLSFNGLEFLEYLDLSHNFIENITPVVFSTNNNLKVLNISDNPLTVKGDKLFLFPAPSLFVLNIASCNFELIDGQLFSNLKELRILNISGNSIKNIYPEVLVELKHLKQLDISKNNLECCNQTNFFFTWLQNRGIQFQPFCKVTEKIKENLILPQESSEMFTKHTKTLNKWNDTVQDSFQNDKNFLENVTNFFRNIPLQYAVLGSLQMGIFLGGLMTYFITKKAAKNCNNLDERSNSNNTDNAPTLTPITPPGTPPPPYYPRITIPNHFSSSYSSNSNS